MSDDRLDRDESAEPAPLAGGWYRGEIVRVYYGSQSGVLRSTATGREYRFRVPFVDIRGPLPRIDALREGMQVGFDLGRTGGGPQVTVIKID